MARSRGGPELRRFMTALPGQIEEKLLRGAARAAANVVADEARERVRSAEVRGEIVVRSSAPAPGQIVAKVTIADQWARSLATWLEYGTAPHFITVDESQRAGRSTQRINRQLGEADGNASLVIGGKFVGATVHHPGAQAHPFLRVSLDVRERDAVAAAQGYINARVRPSGIVGTAEEDDAA